ncbi:MAG: hypothetical protein R3F56_18815 [Planctomycetota bacterium]
MVLRRKGSRSHGRPPTSSQEAGDAAFRESSSRRRACGAVHRGLPELAATGEASPEVLTHLRRCVACRVAFGAFTRANRALVGLADQPAPGDAFFDDLEADTLAAVADLPAAGRRRIRVGGRGWVVAAACLLCAVLGHWLARRTNAPGEALLRRDPLMLPAVRVTSPQPSWLLPVGFTPSRQGLRGQQLLGREVGAEFPAGSPSIR